MIQELSTHQDSMTHDHKLYFEMLRIRMIEEAIAEHYSEQEMRCPVHLSIGQEGVAVGVCAALKPTDSAMSGHRSHAHYLAKGGNLERMLAEIYGKETGCCSGRGGSMHLFDPEVNFKGAVPIVGSTIPIATGLAYADKLKKNGCVTVAFFGEGATEEGVFHESVNFAVLKKLPVIFLCENNFFSVYSPMEVRQPASREVFEMARAHDIDSFQGNGNDAIAVKELTQDAVDKARDGQGPTFLEFKTYRWREHCGPNYDNDIGYRAVEDFEQWKERCPLKTYEDQFGSDFRQGFETEIREEIEAAFAFAQNSPFPSSELNVETVYA